MNDDVAKGLVRETLEDSFDKTRFVRLVKNMLNHVEDAPFTYRGNYIFADFADAISTVERVGKYESPDAKRLDILIVRLKKDTSLERARTKQRNYVAKYLHKGRDRLKDAALVAFVAPSEKDWRFSFIKMQYKFNESGKAEENFTSARRYSFLVGKHENSHTAQSRLLPLLKNDASDPALDELEKAFEVEKVTKEFFEQYRELFWRFQEALDAIAKSNAGVKVNTVDFAKKLLGQIVFLYFLQKKGWFGVARDTQWGDGSRHFLRELFEKKHGGYRNFFNDILEPLFYEALRLERPGDYYSRFDCRIPFLNGGLFDPIDDYDWVNTDVLLPDELFSNKRKTEQGDVGDGVLDVFDRYNFTVKEDEPLEKEVAVDPEMLGKVFENLLEIKDRRSKGTYYTPREIVHYMCRESLINYLDSELNGGIASYETMGDRQIGIFGNETKTDQLDLTITHRPQEQVNKKDIETLIEYGEFIIEHDSRVVSKGSETGTYSFKLPENIRTHAKAIDDSMASIRVCDPAVGSGAFVVGMMHEIVRVRNALTPHVGKQTGRSPYAFKREAIRNCLYGVDSDAGAVEIAKLRLWLSLVVDEEERETIQPLPNLDYKIMQGNSLLGIAKEKMGMKDVFFESDMKTLKTLKQNLFNETGASRKEKYKKQIDELIGKVTNNHKDFDFKVYFFEVFHENEGFDVVIGNPPYIQLQRKGGALGKRYQDKGYETFARTGDIYQLFYEKGLRLAREGRGLLAFITSNSWQRAQYGEKLRRFFSEKHSPLQLIDMGKDVFDNVIVDSNILLIRNGKTHRKCRAVDMDTVPEHIFPPDKKHWVTITPRGAEPWSTLSPVEQGIKAKVEKLGTPLKDWEIQINYGIKTGYNDAFIIDQEKRDELIAADPKSNEIIKPVLRGRDIQRYQAKWARLYLVCTFPALALDINQYPSVKRHLITFGKNRLEQSGKTLVGGGKARKKTNNKWFETQDTIAYCEEFSKEKLVWKRIGSMLRFSFDSEGHFPLDSTCIATGERIKFLTAILNSKFGHYLLKDSPTTGMGEFIVSVQAIEPIRVPMVSAKNRQIAENMEKLVEKILTAKKAGADTTKPEAEIDKLVYQLYGLTDEEIRIVENHAR